MKSALVEYVTTAIEFSDRYARDAFAAFLGDPADGIFRGPFVRTRLPFETDVAPVPLDVLPDWFRPYAHQAAAFRRLTTSPHEPGEKDGAGLRIPEPTIVTTGTGSGKTESFLYPLLDYAVRARAAGVHGIKAIILYPMNALANDQAGRLARMIGETPGLRGVTAALYTGEHSGTPRTTMTDEGLIEDRNTIRSAVPDILLTNYKMLDQLLLRGADRPLWEESARSLRYLVLDEFHTYNGAQGTDVALLIRRLTLLLERLAPRRTTLVPVATSATLGDDRDIAPVADFAGTIFGTEFTPEAVVTERRRTHQDLLDDAVAALGTRVPEANKRPTLPQLDPVLGMLPNRRDGAVPEPAHLTRAMLGVLWPLPYEDVAEPLPEPATLRNLFLAHPLVGRLLETASTATRVAELSRRLVPHLDAAGPGARFVEALCGALSHIRSTAERNSFPNIEVHLWTREVSRVDRAASPAAHFAWSDDRTVHDGTFLPAIYCRHCGRSGWGVALTGTDDLIIRPQRIREENVRRTGRFRALMWSPGSDPVRDDRLRYLNPEGRSIENTPPPEDVADVDSLPVLMHVGLEAEAKTLDDECPSCQEKDGIRFVGSSTATLLSVALSSLFGTEGLDLHEKKSLVFTDSVQDAAHRAGFVEARSHALTLRSAIESALTEDPLPVGSIVQRMMMHAQTPEERYRLLHPSIAENSAVRGYWDDMEQARRRRRAREHVTARLEFDLELEAGLVGAYGRTLATTGTAAASVTASDEELRAVGCRVMERAARQMSLDGHDEALRTDQRVALWVRGVLERLRRDGAIGHAWLTAHRKEGGTRFRLWGGRRPKDVMPAFPSGRRAPQFPAAGRLKDNTEFRDLAGPQSWFADWTARCLQLDRRRAAHLMKPLFTELASAGVLDTVAVQHRGTTTAESFGLRPDRVVMARVPEPAPVLRCAVCGEVSTGLCEVLRAFADGPCTAYRCSGELRWSTLRPSYYRSLYSGDMRRVIAREHTSLLQADERLAYENAFKNSEVTPGSPNVLVATPTLEMGIDIGDLSTVILASIPDSVASYLQRVGRAGRLTGNSLDLAFMSTKGRGSAFIDPEFMVNGSVRPPAAYLSAEEILHRQYTAFLMDRMAGDPSAPQPARAASVMASSNPQTFLGEMLRDARQHAAKRVDEFLSAFTVSPDPRHGITREAADELRAWATWPENSDASSGLEIAVRGAIQQWHQIKDGLRHRRSRITQQLREIEEGTRVITPDEDRRKKQLEGQVELLDAQEQRIGVEEDAEEREKEKRRLTGTRSRLLAEQSQLSHEHWIGVLERFGLLPNFTLYDDAVTLDATLIYQDENEKWNHIPAAFERSGFSALTELAPGNSFYAGGHELTIDAVDLGTDGAGIRNLAFCPGCGFSQEITGGASPDVCPQCHNPGMADEGQHLTAVELTKVYSTMELHRAKISDSADDRRSLSFDTFTVPDFTGAELRQQWSIRGTGVGMSFRRGTRLTRLNVGRPREGARDTILAGQQRRIGGFLLCAECGHLDQDLNTNSPQEHQGWCSQRQAAEPESMSVVLARDITTETVMISLPPSITEDSTGRSVWSFYAALMLGLRERFGGEIDHLNMEVVADVTRDNADSLMLFDSVPGGTGYLAELSSPESLWDLFHTARGKLAECSCQEDGSQEACFRCLMPFVRASKREYLSRARAVEILGDVLGTTDPTAAMNWTLSEQEAGMGEDFESALEKRFRRVFRAAVAEIPGAQVTDTVGDGGQGFSTLLDGTKYTYASQVTLGHTQPDALLTWPGPHGARGIAIYLDGKAFHASPAHNRVGDDAAKRRGLREQGYLVFAITDRDLTAFERSRRDEGDSDGYPDVVEELMDPSAVAVVKERRKITDADHRYVVANPVAQILTIMQSGGRNPLKTQRTVAEFLNMMLFVRPPRYIAPENLGAQALAVLDTSETEPLPHPPVGSVAQGLLRRDGPLVILASLKECGNELAVVLDDREDAVRSPGFDLAWRRWLALSNLRQPEHPQATTTLETWSSLQTMHEEQAQENEWLGLLAEVEAASPGRPTGPAQSARGPVDVVQQPADVALSVQWRELMADALDDSEKYMLTFAAQQEMALPEVGEEVDGIPVDIAWPDLRIAWFATQDHAEAFRERTSEPWTILAAPVWDAQRQLQTLLAENK